MNLGTGKILRELKECQHLHIVSVISSFDCKKNIRPLYLRVGVYANLNLGHLAH